MNWIIIRRGGEVGNSALAFGHVTIDESLQFKVTIDPLMQFRCHHLKYS